ncbi:MAG: cytochrome c oxidase subunit II [Alphaproteobacteria bacterium]|nr:cytochrome c oxidase subunit II [Alphaproteobacteria bacterium]
MPRPPQKTGFFSAVLAGAVAFLFSLPAMAEGFPHPWGLGMQPAGSTMQARIGTFHDILLYIITLIVVFILLLLLYVVIRYNWRINPKPSRTTHNVKLEIVWTLVPCLVLVGIALVSFPLLYYTERAPSVDLTLKVTAHQWYWSYEYPDHGDLGFDSRPTWNASDVTDAQAAELIKESQPGWLIPGTPKRLLEVDNRVVLPTGKNIRVQIAASDVEHSWFVPSLGVNRMGVPGRLSELWMKIDKEGVYYGQCSMICGTGHAFMPIVIEAVAPEKFAAWIQKKQPLAAAAKSTTPAAEEPTPSE